jgi:hypothetical protein
MKANTRRTRTRSSSSFSLSLSLSLSALLLTTGSTTKLSQMLSYCLELPSTTTTVEDHYIGTCSKRMESSHFWEDFFLFYFISFAVKIVAVFNKQLASKIVGSC